MSSVIIIIGLLIYLILYFTYGKKIERDVVKASDSNEAPSKRLFDGVDYIPARRGVLFGHHFASIAGAAPIIGPAVAMCWGWVPGLLWIWSCTKTCPLLFGSCVNLLDDVSIFAT
ncbi:MAG: carbon starvation CstA family protein, partial [Desulfatiglandales bacterium]